MNIFSQEIKYLFNYFNIFIKHFLSNIFEYILRLETTYIFTGDKIYIYIDIFSLEIKYRYIEIFSRKLKYRCTDIFSREIKYKYIDIFPP